MAVSLAWIGGILAILLVLHIAASWAERKGWICYRSESGKGRGVALSNALFEFETLVNPAAEHRIEEERSQRIMPSEPGHGLLDLESGKVFVVEETEPEHHEG